MAICCNRRGCKQYTSHVTFFLVFACMCNNVSHDIGSRCLCASSHPCVMRLCVWSFFDPLFALFICLSHLPLHPPDLSLHLLCGSVRSKTPCALRPMRSLALWSTTPLSQVMSPTSSTTTTSQRPLKISSQESSSDTRPSYLHAIGRALSSPLFTQERQEPAGRRQAYHSLEESLLSSQSLSVGHVITERPVNELSSLSSSVREKPSRDSENEQIRILLERLQEQILADCRAEIQKHEFQADYDRRSIQKLNGIIGSQRGEINRALAGDEQLRRDQQLLHEQWLEQNRELREAH